MKETNNSSSSSSSSSPVSSPSSSSASGVGKRRWLELGVILALVLVSLVWVLLSVILREEGAIAVVAIDGVEIARYELSVDGEYTLGGGTNVLVIKDGEAYMSYADCPDGTCVKTGRVSYRGQTIVCLPNKISVTIVGGDGADLVS